MAGQAVLNWLLTVNVQGVNQLDQLDKRVNKTKSSFGQLTLSLRRAAVLLGTGLGITKAIREFMKLEQSIALLKISTGNLVEQNNAYIQSLEQEATALGKVTGQTKSAIIEAQAHLNLLVKNTDQAWAMTQAMAQLAHVTRFSLQTIARQSQRFIETGQARRGALSAILGGGVQGQGMTTFERTQFLQSKLQKYQPGEGTTAEPIGPLMAQMNNTLASILQFFTSVMGPSFKILTTVLGTLSEALSSLSESVESLKNIGGEGSLASTIMKTILQVAGLMSMGMLFRGLGMKLSGGLAAVGGAAGVAGATGKIRGMSAQESARVMAYFPGGVSPATGLGGSKGSIDKSTKGVNDAMSKFRLNLLGAAGMLIKFAFIIGGIFIVSKFIEGLFTKSNQARAYESMLQRPGEAGYQDKSRIEDPGWIQLIGDLAKGVGEGDLFGPSTRGYVERKRRSDLELSASKIENDAAKHELATAKLQNKANQIKAGFWGTQKFPETGALSGEKYEARRFDSFRVIEAKMRQGIITSMKTEIALSKIQTGELKAQLAIQEDQTLEASKRLKQIEMRIKEERLLKEMSVKNMIEAKTGKKASVDFTTGKVTFKDDDTRGRFLKQSELDLLKIDIHTQQVLGKAVTQWEKYYIAADKSRAAIIEAETATLRLNDAMKLQIQTMMQQALMYELEAQGLDHRAESINKLIEMEQLRRQLIKSGMSAADAQGILGRRADIDKSKGEIGALQYQADLLRGKRDLELRGAQLGQKPGMDSYLYGGSYQNQMENLKEQIPILEEIKGHWAAIGNEIKVQEIDGQIMSIKEQMFEMATASTILTDAIGGNMENAFQSIIDGSKSISQAFGDMANAIIVDITMIIARLAIWNVMMSMFGPQGALAPIFGNMFGIVTNMLTPFGVPGKAAGGFVGGSGFGDTVPTMLSPGELVLNRAQQGSLGQHIMDLETQKPTYVVNAIGDSDVARIMQSLEGSNAIMNQVYNNRVKMSRIVQAHA